MDINSTNKFENQNEPSQLLPSSYTKNEMLILVLYFMCPIKGSTSQPLLLNNFIRGQTRIGISFQGNIKYFKPK